MNPLFKRQRCPQFRYRRCSFFIFLTLAALCTQALGEDYSWVESDELKMELNARRKDMKRTEERLTELRHQLKAEQEEIVILNQHLDEIENRLVQRTSMLYRLSKNGKSVQYLFGSDSIIAFVKRMQTLRLLVTSQMDAKREVSLQLTRVEDEMERTRAQMESAKTLVGQLTATVDALQKELTGRRSGRRHRGASSRGGDYGSGF
jgi:peptidoglycan hydrolase CwlO-like protein